MPGVHGTERRTRSLFGWICHLKHKSFLQEGAFVIG